ncbi:MAG: M56 family metallopeptidase [Planctomycetota bacterium]
MIDWQLLIRHPFMLTTGWALVHALWLGVVLAGGLWVVLRIMPPRPAARYHVCAITLLSIPILLALALTMQRPWLAPHSLARQVPVVEQTLAPNTLPMYVLPAEGGGGAEPEAGSPRVTVFVPLANEAGHATQRGQLPTVLSYAALFYVFGLLVMGIRLLGVWWLTLRLRTSGLRPLPESMARLAERAYHASGVRRPVQFAIGARAVVPCVVGLLRPIVLLPASAVSGLTPEQLSAVIAHELAHIRRHDVFVNLLQVLLETLLFFHPAVWWIGGQLRAERECCCDKTAADSVGSALIVAHALAATAGVCRSRPKLALAATSGPLHTRVRRLLATDHASQGRSSVRGAGLLVLLILGVLLSVVACGGGVDDQGEESENPANASNEPVDSAMPPPLVDPNVPAHQARVLKIDYQKLKAGDMRFNVVIQPGDLISVPDPSAGFVYIMGKVERSGAYTISRGNEMTLYRLVTSAGGLHGLDTSDAGPLYVDLARELPNDRQKIYHFNLTDIANGDASDIYLCPNDVVNVGVEPRTHELHAGPEPDDAGVRPIIDEPRESNHPEGVIFSPITEADLTPDHSSRVIVPGDSIRVTIFELRIPGVDDVQEARVGEGGELRLAILGAIQAEGMTEQQLELAIAEKLDQEKIFRNATVNAQIVVSRKYIYTVLAQNASNGTMPGTYVIPKADFRLTEALAVARGVSSLTDYVYVIRGGMNQRKPQGRVPVESDAAMPASEPVDASSSRDDRQRLRIEDIVTTPGRSVWNHPLRGKVIVLDPDGSWIRDRDDP